MKRFLVSATTAAVLSALSSGAMAVVNLDDGTGAANYASQRVVAGTTALTGAAVDVSSTLGFGVSGLQQRFVRYDLTNAKFAAAVASGDLTLPIAVGNIVVSGGGAAGGTYVIFEVTAAAGGIPQNTVLTFLSGSGATAGLKIQSAAAPVQMSYSLYQDAASAVAGGAAGRLNTNFAAQTVAGLVSGLAFSAAPGTTTVDVAAAKSYTRFIAGAVGTSTTVAQIGTVSLGAATNVLDPGTGVQVLYPALVAAGTALELKGDFGAAAAPSSASTGVFLGPDNGNCGAPGTAPTPATPTTSASFATGATPVVARPLCFTLPANNTVQIPAQAFTVQANITPAANSTAGNLAPIDAGKFIRNGLVLKAAFAETTAASGVSSSVTLNNTSNNDAPYTVACLVNSVGAVAGTPGTVKAHSSTRLSLSGIGCPTNGTLRGLEITMAVTPGSVVGSVARQNTSTGQASFDAMTGNQ